MQLHLKITGVILILLALLHLVFPRYFKWGKELASLSLVNRQMTYVHTFFIALMLFLMGLLCLSSSWDLMTTDLGRTLGLGLGIFWTTRLFIQFFGYSALLWKGKIFETVVHALFTMLWIYLSTVFLYLYYRPVE
jgi:hypothetical protein